MSLLDGPVHGTPDVAILIAWSRRPARGARSPLRL